MLAASNPDLIFVKTSKTAGTTTEVVLQQALWGANPAHSQAWQIERNGFCSSRGISRTSRRSRLSLWSSLRIATVNRLPVSSLGRLKILEQHSTPRQIREAVGEVRWTSSIKIANVRNPLGLMQVLVTVLVTRPGRPVFPSLSQIRRASNDPTRLDVVSGDISSQSRPRSLTAAALW